MKNELKNELKDALVMTIKFFLILSFFIGNLSIGAFIFYSGIEISYYYFLLLFPYTFSLIFILVLLESRFLGNAGEI